MIRPRTSRSSPRASSSSKRPATRTVEIQHAEQAVATHDRHHDLGVRRRVARDVAGERMHVRHDERAALRCRRAAHALAERNTHAGGLALERADQQVAGCGVDQVEADPVEIAAGYQ